MISLISLVLYRSLVSAKPFVFHSMRSRCEIPISLYKIYIFVCINVCVCNTLVEGFALPTHNYELLVLILIKYHELRVSYSFKLSTFSGWYFFFSFSSFSLGLKSSPHKNRTSPIQPHTTKRTRHTFIATFFKRRIYFNTSYKPKISPMKKFPLVA